MSSAFSPPLSVTQASKPLAWRAQIFNATPKSTPDGKAKSVERPETKPTTSFNTTQATISGISANGAGESSRKRRRLTYEEETVKEEIAASIAMNLAMDHIMTLYPDADTPFQDELDVVNRLLPYHIFQHPQQDLTVLRGGVGKNKETDVEQLRKEVKETKFALTCHKRYRVLEKKFRQIRMRSGRRPSPNGQAIALERSVLEEDHNATSAMDQELSTARSELDKLLRAQRVAKMAASRQTQHQQTPSNYYGFSPTTATFSANPSAATPYYSTYTYPYGHSYMPGASYGGASAAAKYASSTIPGVSTFQANAGPSTPAGTKTTPQNTAPGSSATSGPSSTVLSLQIPVTALPALQALGILPVPKAVLPPPTEQQPAAVLLGSTSNGSMLSVEINASLLQGSQMNGLVVLLTSILRMSGGLPNVGRSDNPSSAEVRIDGTASTTAPTTAANLGSTSAPQASNAASVHANSTVDESLPKRPSSS